MKIEHEELRSIKQLDLPSLIQKYGLQLRKNGSNTSYQLLCPFHEDKNPSLSISYKNSKWLWHCFGCHKSGNVIDFVIQYERINFSEAYEKLLKESGHYRVAETSTPSEIKPPDSSINKQQLFERAITFYHNTLMEDKRGLEYLEKRGIKDGDALRRFKLGYVNGTMRNALPKDPEHEVIRGLKEIGILNEKGTERFYNCVVFPIFDENTAVVGMYGRNTSSFSPQHLYLPGPHRGTWNHEAFKAHSEVILTECIIDALSLYVLGIKNAVPLYGVNGLTANHMRLMREHRTQKVSLCFDNDSAGKEARMHIKEKIVDLGITVEDIHLPSTYKDINESLQKGFTIDGFRRLMYRAPNTQHPGSSGPKVEETGDTILIHFGARNYRVRGLSTKSLEHIRVNVKVQDHEAYHLDTFDLYSSRARSTFIHQSRILLRVEEREITKELNQVIQELEKIQAKLVDVALPKPPPAPTPEEEEEALHALKSPTLLKNILKDLEELGYVGEEANKAIGYLVAISRKLEDPLSCVIISQSSAGKSVLVETLEKLVPSEDCLFYSRITPHALYYMDRDALKRKLLIIEERVGAEGADYSIRTLQSKKKLIQAVPVKDPSSGKIKTITFEVEGPIAYIETTTQPRIHEENATRCFELYLDESKEQTHRIHLMQREAKTLNGFKKKKQRDAVIKKHQNMQRVLRTIRIVNPFAHLLEFPTEWLRTRRDHLRFLNLIEATTFLYQYQRQPKQTESGEEYIESTVEDYRIAYRLAREVLGESFTELKKPQRELLKEVEKLVEQMGGETTRREIREHTGLPDRRLRELLQELQGLEYLRAVDGKQGKSYRYKLADRSVSTEKILIGLTTPEELANKMNLPTKGVDNFVQLCQRAAKKLIA